MAMPSVPTTGKAETASGPWVTVAVAGVPAVGPAGPKCDRDRHAVDQDRDRAAREGDRVVDGIDAGVNKGVRAGDVVHAGVAGVLGDRAGRRVGRRVAPIDRRREFTSREARRRREGQDRRGERPDDRVDVLEALDAVDSTAGPGVMTSGADVGDVDLLVIDRVDDARAGNGNEHFAGQQSRRDGRDLAAGVVVERVGAGTAVQEQHRAVRDAQPGDVGHVFVRTAVQGSDHTGRRVDERDGVVAAGGCVEREARAARRRRPGRRPFRSSPPRHECPAC